MNDLEYLRNYFRKMSPIYYPDIINILREVQLESGNSISRFNNVEDLINYIDRLENEIQYLRKNAEINSNSFDTISQTSRMGLRQ